MFITKKLWKRSFFYFLIALACIISAVVIGGGIYLCWFYNIRELPPPPDTRRLEKVVRNGDVILRSGVGLWSELFRSRNSSDKRFSHVGIVWLHDDGSFWVIHSEGNDTTGSGTVAAIPLEKFVNESQAVGVSRLRQGDPDLLVASALSFCGRPFDWKFNTDDAQAVYCTELVYLALQKSAPEVVLPRIDNIILPEACLCKEYFTEIAVPPTAD